jgi:hypothetical protein
MAVGGIRLSVVVLATIALCKFANLHTSPRTPA